MGAEHNPQWARPAQDPIAAAKVDGSGPIVVVATTGDVPTPYRSSVNLASTLGANLVEWEADQHTAYLSSRCVGTHVDAFLVDLTIPPPGTRCDDAPSYWIGVPDNAGTTG